MGNEGNSLEWYTNKELFERLGDLKDDFAELKSEMKETRTLIKNYNGLREEIEKMRVENESIKEQVQIIISKSQEKKSIMESAREWGGWVFALISLYVLIYNQLH